MKLEVNIIIFAGPPAAFMELPEESVKDVNMKKL
jgi:hypothetical protein